MGTTHSSSQISELELAAFSRHGYLVLQQFADPDEIKLMRQVAAEHLESLIAPIEYELDVQYPGSPADMNAPGAQTSRRLLQAYARHQVFRSWARSPKLGAVLSALYQSAAEPMLSQCHHNCVMTKAPGYSSATLWHQDNRYWSFDREDLISAWLALGDETKSNGCLRVIPGSHLLDIDPGRFDAALFLRPDLAENKQLMSQSVRVELQEGDLLLFHSRLFHAAGRNLTSETKLSLVFTYHQADNLPIANSRSARFPSLRLGE